MEQTKKLSWEKIHAAIHGGADVVYIGDIPHKVKVSATNGCRYVNYTDSLLGKVMIMAQNPKKDSVHARRAKAGETLSWVIPIRGDWKLIDTPVKKEVRHES